MTGHLSYCLNRILLGTQNLPLSTCPLSAQADVMLSNIPTSLNSSQNGKSCSSGSSSSSIWSTDSDCEIEFFMTNKIKEPARCSASSA